MLTTSKKISRNKITLSKKEYESLKRAAEELDTLKAILLYEEEKRGKTLKSFKNINDLMYALDH